MGGSNDRRRRTRSLVRMSAFQSTTHILLRSTLGPFPIERGLEPLRYSLGGNRPN